MYLIFPVNNHQMLAIIWNWVAITWYLFCANKRILKQILVSSAAFAGYSSQEQCIHLVQLYFPTHHFNLSSVKLPIFKLHDWLSYTICIVSAPSVLIRQKASQNIAEACNIRSHWWFLDLKYVDFLFALKERW